MSKIFNFAMAAAMAVTALVATQTAPAQAYTHSGYSSAMTCDYVYVSGRGAYLQHNPTLHSRRYRTAPHGEQFMVVKDNWGRAHHTGGWYLVKSRQGMRYWAHRSVLSCSSGEKYTAATTHSKQHKDTDCEVAMVSASFAYGKKHPTLRSHTLRNIPHGEKLNVTRDSDGHANYSKGWWFLSNETGQFWVHDSVVTCSQKKQ